MNAIQMATVSDSYGDTQILDQQAIDSPNLDGPAPGKQALGNHALDEHDLKIQMSEVVALLGRALLEGATVTIRPPAAAAPWTPRPGRVEPEWPCPPPRQVISSRGPMFAARPRTGGEPRTAVEPTDSANEVAHFDSFEIDFTAHELRADGARVHLQPQVFDVLAYLARRPGRMVPREVLLDKVWGDRFVSTSALASRIKSARAAVGDDGKSQRVIRTVHSRGFMFVAPLL